MSSTAGVDEYISGISLDSKIKAIQLWQFLGSKVLFRLSCASFGENVCSCGIHIEYSTYISNLGIKCMTPKPSKYNLSDYPIHDIVHDGYEYNKKFLNGCHKLIFT